MRYQVTVALAIAVLGVTSACSGDSARSAISPTADTQATQAVAASGELHDEGKRVGIPGIDSLLEAAENHDTAALLDQTRYFDVPCANATDSVLPECPQGSPEGTPVSAALHGNCERDWVARTVVGPDDFQTYFEEDLGLFAVAKLAPPSRTIDEGGNPPAEYLVILGVRDDTRGIARTFLIDGENVVRSTLGCQQTPRESLAAAQANGDIVQLVVAPPD